MKSDDPINMEEVTEDEDGSASKNINSGVLETDDGTGTNSDGNQNDDGLNLMLIAYLGFPFFC